MDYDKKSNFESKLAEIYHKSSWLKYEISLEDFLNLFPAPANPTKPLRLEAPQGIELDRTTYLAVRVAYRQAFG